MKKTLTLLLVALFATQHLFADDVSAQQALQIAGQFAVKNPTASSKMRKASIASPTPTLAYTVKSSVTNKDNVYVINYGNDQGFVVVSGEDGTNADILGYCDHGAFSYDEAPVQMKDLLKSYSAGIDMLRENPSLATSVMRKANADLGTIVVAPLLTTQWSQWAPYNNLCPEGCPTGCVPTAIAQVMYYWRWPNQTIGEVQGVDFSGRTYDWDNMLSNYDKEPYNATQAQAIAQLMADIGKACGTHYSPEGSGTGLSDYFMVQNFGYEPGSKSYTAKTASELISEMAEELNERRPILYSGDPDNSSEDGHALVVDGYTSNNYFHFNYGWGGSYDGFYKNAAIPLYANDVQIFTHVRPWDAEYAEVGDIKYALLKNGEAHVFEYLKDGVTEETVEIPATITVQGNTYKVTRICQHSFYQKGRFSKVVIGENVEKIDAYSFINSKISELVLNDKMEEVPDESFIVSGISKLTIGASIKRIGKKAFYTCPVSEVICKSPAFEVDDDAFGHSRPDCGDWLDCITSLGKEAFAGATFRSDPHFAKLESIGSEAFAGIGFSEKKFVLPSKLKYISPDAFKGSTFYGFEANEENPYLHVGKYWLLYNSNETSLVMASNANWDIGDELFSFPETLVKLEPGCISSRRGHGVTIPNHIIEMEGAFSNCEWLGYLTCLAAIPPVISDETFSDKIFENKPEIILYVPEGTEELYRHAPGWRRFTDIRGTEPYVPAPAQQGREYYMVLHGVGGQNNVSIPVSDIADMHVDETTGKPVVVVSRNGKDDITAQTIEVDSITWMNGFVYENAEIFDLNEENLTAKAQKCTVTLDPTVIDEDVQMCIRNAVLTPNAIDGCTRGVTVDVSLSNGAHELSGTAKITIPVDPKEDERVCAAYFNEETGEWEPVMFHYDEEQGAVVINTDHLCLFSAFFVKNPESARAVIQSIYDEYPLYNDFYGSVEALHDIVTDPNYQDMRDAAINKWKDDYGFWQSVGIDGGWNMLQALGFSSDAVSNATDAVGWLGTAATIFDVIRADLKGDDIGVASGTLKVILNVTTSQLASAVGTGIMQASMGCVAFIGVALEKFGTMVQERKKELYNEAYRLYYSKRGDSAVAGVSKYGKNWRRTHKDWYDYFYPAFEKGMPEHRLRALIDAAVREYCERFWEDTDAQAMCVAEAKATGLSTWFFPDEATRKEISDAYYADLMNGDLVSVFEAIKNNLAAHAGKRYGKAMKDYLGFMNTTLVLQFVDSSCKEGEKSKYADWWVRFSDNPKYSDSKLFKRYITENGRASMGLTMYSLIHNQMKSEITLSNPEEVDQATYKFEIPEGTGRVVVTIDLATGGVNVEAPELKGLELTYDPAEIETPLDIYGDYDIWGDGSDILYTHAGEFGDRIYLGESDRYEKVRFQKEIEKFFKRNDFISVDKSGNIKIGDNIVGKMEGTEGTGKFTITTTYPFTEKTKEEFVKQFNDKDYDFRYRFVVNLLNGTLKHKIDCQLKLVPYTDGKTYSVTYTGEGTYSIDAEYVGRVDNADNVWWHQGSVGGTDFYGTHHITVDDLTTQKVEAEGKVTLKYSTVLRE